MPNHFLVIAAWLTALLSPLVLGWPMGALLGIDKGLRSIGFAAAIGLSLLLIVCRAVQVWVPIEPAADGVWMAYAIVGVVLWVRARGSAMRLVKDFGLHIAIIGAVVIGMTVVINAPILFGNAIQFDGSRNADSFTWTSNARYMLSHTFGGAPWFDPSHPVFGITGSYLGDHAIQPRVATEGFLAWISATWCLDPMYEFNLIQTTGMLLGSLSLLVFLPKRFVRSFTDFGVLLPLLLGSPAVIFIAINSNFPNGLTLAAAAGYLGLGALPRKPGTFAAAVIFLGALISGYPELMLFVGAVRAFATIGEGVAARRSLSTLREISLLGCELVVACALLPWAAKGALTTYVTMLTMSHAGVTDQIGNMYAALPNAALATILLALAWRSMKPLHDERSLRVVFVSVLFVFGLTQIMMVVRGYAYGGFKLSQYFAIPLAAVTAVCSASLLAKASAAPRARFSLSILMAVLVISVAVVWSDVRVIERSWRFAQDRRLTVDLIAARDWLRSRAPEASIAKGSTPAPFYYGHWLPYVIGAHMVYDWQDPDAAGYLSPYLREADPIGDRGATFTLSIEQGGDQSARRPSDVAVFGNVHISQSRSP